MTEMDLFNSYTGNFRRHFDCLSFARRPRKKKCARVSHEMTQFVLKIALLAISMQPTPFPSYGLLPRLWLLVLMNILGLLELQAVAK